MHTEISPWIEKLSLHRLRIAIAGVMLALAVALAWVAWRWSVAEDRMVLLQRQADAGFLQAPSTSRGVRVDLRAPGVVAVGDGRFPERVDFRLNAAGKRHSRFRVSLLRDDGALLLRADQLVRDSNMDLRLSLNSSILPQGGYALRVEGYARGGKLERVAEARLRAGGR